MNLAFSSRELRTLCKSQTVAERAYGVVVARELRGRLADIREAGSVLELLAGHPREVSDGRHRCYEVSLPEAYRLLICANHDPLPFQGGTGRIDWSRVSRVRIASIDKVEGQDG